MSHVHQHATFGTKQLTITDIQIDKATVDTMWICKQTRKHMQSLYHGPTYNTHNFNCALPPAFLLVTHLSLPLLCYEYINTLSRH